MAEKKRTRAAKRSKADEYSDDESLRQAVQQYCVVEWKRLTGADWTEERRCHGREILDAYRRVLDAYRGLVTAIELAQGIVERYPRGATDAPDFRVEILQSFFESLSPATARWVDVQLKARDAKWLHDENERARIAHWQTALGLPTDPHQLAVLSLLLGNAPREIDLPARVSHVVESETKAMREALRRLHSRLPLQSANG